MRRLALIMLSAGGLAACSANLAQPYQRTARQENELRQALAGKVAMRPVDCLPTFRSADMQVIDDNTLLFHDGGNRVFVQLPSGGCAPIGSGHYTLVTNIIGSSRLCRGDISRVVDLTGGGFTVGSCAMNEFVPYERPRR